MVIQTLSKWPKESFIEDTELIREIFGLLLRQYNGVAEVNICLTSIFFHSLYLILV